LALLLRKYPAGGNREDPVVEIMNMILSAGTVKKEPGWSDGWRGRGCCRKMEEMSAALLQ